MQNTHKLEKEIKVEFNRKVLNTYQDITNIKVLDNTNLVLFTASGKGFSARLTPKTGQLKRNSIRIDV